jgi:molecular chaperone DnaK (HSP70)
VAQSQKTVIGIDLGTTNSALAFAEPPADPRESAPVNLFPIPQLVNPGEVREESLLPSFLYIAGANDFPAGSLELPWPADAAHVVGELAKKRGAENARRLVSSAKSWLSHAGVDRTASILPPGAPEGVDKISPVAA